MHKQLKGMLSWAVRRKLLLFVLLFAILLRCVSLYSLTRQNSQLAERFANHLSWEKESETVSAIQQSLDEATLAALVYRQQPEEKYRALAENALQQIPVLQKELAQSSQQLLIPATIQQPFCHWMEVRMDAVKAAISQSQSSNVNNASLSATNPVLDSPAVAYRQFIAANMGDASREFRNAGRLINGQAYASAFSAVVLMLIVFYILLREILHRNKMNRELETQKEYFNTTLNSIAEGMIATGPRGEIRFLNRAAEKLTGWKNDEARHQPLEKVYRVSREDNSPVQKNIVHRILHDRQTVEFENHTLLHSRSEQRFQVSNYGSPVFNAAGDVSGTVLVFSDVSEKTKMENQLRISQKKYKDLVEQAADGIFLLDTSGNFLSANPCGCAMLGCCEEELLRLNISSFIPPAYAGKKLVDLSSMQNGQPVLLERQFINRQGIAFYTEVRALLTTEANIQSIVRDITARKTAEEKMMQLMERYDILSSATSDTIWDWDIRQNRVTYNNGILAMFGYEHITATDGIEWWKQHIHPDDRCKITSTLDKMFTGQLDYTQMQYRFRCEDGSYKYIYDRAFLLFDAGNRPMRMIGAMQDITYQKEEEKQIAKATLQAQENERYQLGIELHDNVNQILVGALLNLGMMKQVSPDKSTELLEKSRAYITDAINEIRKLSHRLAPASAQDMALKELFGNLLKAVNVENQYSITLHMDDFEKEKVSEEIQVNLYRILQEQLNNIVKHANATAIKISVTLTGQRIQFRITDNGVGFLLSNERKGIGLNNIRKRAESCAGKFSVRTAPGKGCEIFVDIPLECDMQPTS